MKYIISIVVVVILAASLYLNRAYAHIFSTIHNANIATPSETDLILPGVSTTTLVYAALGDSLTAGVGVATASATFPYQLAEYFQRQTSSTLRLVNFGIPGAGVAGVIDNELPLALSMKPDVVTILIGTNDMFNRVPLTTFQKNLTVLLQRLRAVKKIILLTIPDLGSSKLILPPYREYFDSQAGNYNNAIRGAGSGFTNVTIIDLHALQKKQPLPDHFYAADEFHPSAVGYTYWSNLIYAHLGP